MKVSYNWLKDYLDIDLPWEELSKILTDIGLEVEGEEQTESVKGGLKGLVVGEVTFRDKHPNADKLSISRINIGAEELHIVCGAPNLAEGQKVVVATIGTMLYPNEGEPFKIKKGKIRGEVSEGMICAEDEIGLGASHDGIMVLPADTVVGTPASEFFKVEKDTIFEIGLTPNRSDATSQLGVAKDLAAALKINNAHSGKVNVPDVSAFKVDNHDLPIEVIVENSEACPRYAGVSIKGVTIKESPEWLKKRLRSLGIATKNNIVDITNFILHELGQPLHAFDADEIEGGKVIVKNLADGSKFTTLDEIERKLSEEDLMICDGDSNGMCIAGVFGGTKSGVKDSTTNIFLESAHFNAISIRRSSTRHLLRTDAAKCYEKGSDANICVFALKRAALLIQELGGGTIASEITDIYPNKVAKATVEVKFSHVNRLIGDDLTKEEVRNILSAMEIEILTEEGDDFKVAIPTNKVDVTREADVIEEILRIYGLNKVAIPRQVKSALTYGLQPDPFKIRNIAGDLLAANGFNEMMAVSITESKYFKEILPMDESQLIYINNTANMHLDVMRPSMLFSGLEAIQRNQNRRSTDLRLFEFGHTYLKGKDDYIESEHLTLFMTGQRHPEGWLNKDKQQVTFYSLKSYVLNLMERLGLNGFQESDTDSDVFGFGMKFHRGPQVLVELGRVKGKLSKAMDIKNPVFYADFNWDLILKALRKHKIDFVGLNKFPTMRRDLALVLDTKVKFSEVQAIAKKTGKKLLQSVNLFDVFEDQSKLGEGKKSYAISMVFEDASKTLKDKDVDKVMSQMIQNFEKKLGAIIRT
jgi:phenylalanyl-tRNA synthetase beta chain